MNTNSEGGTTTSGGIKDSKQSCDKTKDAMKDNAQADAHDGGYGGGLVTCGDGTYYSLSWGDGVVIVVKHGNLFEGGNPMPYTGSNWGIEQPKNPGTIGGKEGENDDAKLMPVIRNGGQGYQGGGGTNATDGPSEWDDGNWYGGIFGGGDVFTDNGGPLPIDPKPH